jgi:transcriptional regulator with XRE-family HTH domain
MPRTNRRLRELRKQRNLSQGQLALRVGVDRSYITKIEQGHRIPAVEVLKRLAGYLGCPLEDLIGITFEVSTKEAPVVHG